MSILEYKGYHGTVESDLERDVMRGKILFIADLVTYQAETLSQLKKEFEAAVEDYFETCKELKREPQQPASGNFNVRTKPELHRSAQVRALLDGVSMNEVITRALGCYLNNSREVREKHVETRYIALQDAVGLSAMLIPIGSESKEVRRAIA